MTTSALIFTQAFETSLHFERETLLWIRGQSGHLCCEATEIICLTETIKASIGTYVGWITPFNSPLVLILPEPVKESSREAVVQLIRIGYERIEGYLDGGIDAWMSSGRSVSSYSTASVDDLCKVYLAGQPLQLLDVRQKSEWDSGHIPYSLHVFLGDLPGGVGGLPRDKEVWVACASGHRASIAASFLDREGVPVRLVAQGGVPEWLARCYPQRAATEAIL